MAHNICITTSNHLNIKPNKILWKILFILFSSIKLFYINMNVHMCRNAFYDCVFVLMKRFIVKVSSQLVSMFVFILWHMELVQLILDTICPWLTIERKTQEIESVRAALRSVKGALNISTQSTCTQIWIEVM